VVPSESSSDLREQLQDALGAGYIRERELGGGGMARVFVATEATLGRRVVVKVLPPEIAGAVSSERFRREVQLAARLQHPHVVAAVRAPAPGVRPPPGLPEAAPRLTGHNPHTLTVRSIEGTLY
jgi:serine/threonine protein kinase